jgi:hypothetical protein
MADLQTAVGNGVKLVGETLVPGASELIEGHVRSGIGHFLVGGVLVAVLAPSFPLLAGLAGIGVRLNSYSQSVSGRNLIEAVRGEEQSAQAVRASEQSAEPVQPARGRPSSSS